MKLENITKVSVLADFLSGSQAIAFAVAVTKDERYRQVECLLKQMVYKSLNRKDKGVVIEFLVKVSTYSRQQITRMIKQYVSKGYVKRHQRTVNGFRRRYTPEDICLLAKMDERHDTPNGGMIKKLCERAHHKYHEKGYERLANISVSHIYNLRKGQSYQKQRRHFEKTRSPQGINIGERRKPQPQGSPGYIRIDTVHQGDLDGKKGVYHINAVDEVTQFEIVATVEKISEHYLIPVLEQLIAAFPFSIINFHSDNGSEYVNKVVAALLTKLHIEFTKSRARHSNDNGLAEGKNAAVVRKTFGKGYIDQKHADKINQFNRDVLNVYVNYHRPCYFPTVLVDEKGKQRKKYKLRDMMTPYDKLKLIEGAQQYLKPGVTFKMLDDIADAMSDNQVADRLQEQRGLLFKNIHEDYKVSA